MKILHINTFSYGGAANACIRLHTAMLDSGMDSHIMFRFPDFGVKNSIAFKAPYMERALPPLAQRVKSKVDRIAQELNLTKPKPAKEELEQNRRKSFLASRPHSSEWFSYPDSGIDLTASKAYQDADIIHLHWVVDFMDWSTFFKKNSKPLVWTLHDQNPFLGGRHYAERYRGMSENGFPEPLTLSKEEEEEERCLTELKMSSLASVNNIHVVAPSVWLHKDATASQLFGRFTQYHIPYAISNQVFKPLDQTFCRRVLGIPENKRVVLFVADGLGKARKGFDFLKKALNDLPSVYAEKLVLCSVGGTGIDYGELEAYELKAVKDERLMQVVYSAADVFVIPSLEDNLPNTMIESIMCGTPVLGFPTGGIPDVIGREFGNGLVTNEISSHALKSLIIECMTTEGRWNKNKISEEAHNRFGGPAVAKAYLQVYQTAMDKSINRK